MCHDLSTVLGENHMDIMREALDFAMSQASQRTMTAYEVLEYAKDVAVGLRKFEKEVLEPSAEAPAKAPIETPVISTEEAMKSIGQDAVTCLICGKQSKMLTKKHLVNHGLTPATYREKFGIPKGTPLSCKKLQEERRNKMQDVRLWEHRPQTLPALTDNS